MKISRYVIKTSKPVGRARFAVVSDLHARPADKVLEAIKRIAPDAILLPGDIVEIAAEYMDARNQNGLHFLKAAAKIAPCYYCYGNHEIYYSHAKRGQTNRPEGALAEKYLEQISAYGVHLINDRYESLPTSESGRILVGGLVCGRDMDPDIADKAPDFGFVKRFDEETDFKILLCHYPHYFEKHLKDTGVDLVLSGHAHGGQWRIFGRGVYAPHQGIFPRYTSGIHKGRHIISRGAVNNAKPIPRFFNPCEVIEVVIETEDKV